MIWMISTVRVQILYDIHWMATRLFQRHVRGRCLTSGTNDFIQAIPTPLFSVFLPTLESNTIPIGTTRTLRFCTKGSCPGPFSMLKCPGVTANSSRKRPGIPCHGSGNLIQTTLSLRFAHPETCGHSTVRKYKTACHTSAQPRANTCTRTSVLIVVFPVTHTPMYVLCNG